MDFYEEVVSGLLEEETFHALRAYLNLPEKELVGYACYTALKQIKGILRSEETEESICSYKIQKITDVLEALENKKG